jgi:hypothetical protein
MALWLTIIVTLKNGIGIAGSWILVHSLIRPLR